MMMLFSTNQIADLSIICRQSQHIPVASKIKNVASIQIALNPIRIKYDGHFLIIFASRSIC